MPGRARLAVAVVAATAGVLLAGCGGADVPSSDGPDQQATTPATGPSVLTRGPADCDQDQTTQHAKDVIERVGGLIAEDWTVALAQSTRLGVIALVEDDLEAAYTTLVEDYGVALVARIEPGEGDGVTGFSQIQELVDRACGTRGR